MVDDPRKPKTHAWLKGLGIAALGGALGGLVQVIPEMLPAALAAPIAAALAATIGYLVPSPRQQARR